MPVDDKESWSPLSLRETIAMFDQAPFRWWICGGLALEIHLGYSWRDQHDTDVGVVRDDFHRWGPWLTRMDMRLASLGRLTKWSGERPDPSKNQNNLWLRTSAQHPWSIDVTISEGNDEAWIYRRHPELTRPWSEAVLTSGDGVPYLAPDLQLLFKSRRPRPKDIRDAREVLPKLSEEELGFLRDHLPEGHPWTLLAG